MGFLSDLKDRGKELFKNSLDTAKDEIREIVLNKPAVKKEIEKVKAIETGKAINKFLPFAILILVVVFVLGRKFK